MLRRGDRVVKLVNGNPCIEGTVLAIFQDMSGKWLAAVQGDSTGLFFMSDIHSLQVTAKYPAPLIPSKA